jgi:enoyl-CoA hydratase/carnithine racemase
VITFDRSGGVATIQFARPEKKNAFTPEMLESLLEYLGTFLADSELRVAIITGSGDSFCAGADLGDLGATRTPLQHKEHLQNGVQAVARLMNRIDKPIIAAVNGIAIGAGMDLSVMCDMRIASDRARFREPFVEIGLVPGDGSCYFLPRLVGLAKAFELLITTDYVAAHEAARIGLVNEVVEHANLMTRTTEMAHRIAKLPQDAVRLTKRALYQSARTDLDTSLDLISSHMGLIRASEESQRAFAALRAQVTPRIAGPAE